MKTDKAETLEKALREMMQHIRAIASLEEEIDEKWGVTAYTGFIYSSRGNSGDVTIRRGIEAVGEALGKEPKDRSFTPAKEIQYHGIHFIQYPDDKTKTFVKAGKKAPKVVIVEDDEDEQRRGSTGTDD